MRVLAVDYGKVRCGLAVSDRLGTTAQPLEVVIRPPKGSLVQSVLDVALRVEAELIVVGLPLKMDGTPGREAEAAKAFAKALEERSGLAVRLWDERLSTVEASRGLRQAGMSAKRQRGKVDMVAAAVVLRSFLESRHRERPDPGEAALPEPDARPRRGDAGERVPERRTPAGAKKRRQALRRSRRDWQDDDL